MNRWPWSERASSLGRSQPQGGTRDITCPSEGEDYGQDANHLSDAAMSYVDNGDGTVTDDATGLTWQQVPSSETFTKTEAVDYANDLELGGYDDWRVPSSDELYSISNFGLGWPYLEADSFSLAEPLPTTPPA